jgi:hypothetical protein
VRNWDSITSRSKKILPSPKDAELFVPTQHPLQWTPEILPQMKPSKRAADLVLLSRAEVKKVWS